MRVIGYDGSKAGPDSSEVALRINSPRALARLATAPGTLGLARAYVSGEIEVEGDLYELLAAMADLTLHDLGRGRAGSGSPGACCRSGCGTASRRPPLEYRPAGAAALQAARLARPSRTTTTCPTASTSGCSGRRWPTRARCYPTASATLEEAQTAKHELVAQKLALEPGMRLLDVGLRLGRHGHARRGRARRQGAGRHALAQPGRVGAGGDRRAAGSAAWPRCATCDYRDAPESQFDAISSIGLTEHIGRANLRGLLRVAAHPAAAGRAAAQPLHHPAAHARQAARPVHRPLRVPRRPAGAGRADHLAR